LSRIKGILVVIQFSLTVALVIIFMYLFRNNTHKIIKIWMSFQMFFLGVKIDEVGKMDETCDLLLMNHQSLLDILVVEHIHSRHIAWVGKSELTNMPFFGHIMKAPRMITINREDKQGIVSLFKEAKDRLDKGRPIAIFPEGTRTDGDKLLEFKAGAKLLANKYELRVQPMVIFNTREILDSRRFTSAPGTIKIVYLKPIQAKRKTPWFEDMEAQMQEILDEGLKEKGELKKLKKLKKKEK